MTLNVKKAMISYCYFFALINLIESSGFIPNIYQKKESSTSFQHLKSNHFSLKNIQN